jgi:hypothetical protein
MSIRRRRVIGRAELAGERAPADDGAVVRRVGFGLGDAVAAVVAPGLAGRGEHADRLVAGQAIGFVVVGEL